MINLFKERKYVIEKHKYDDKTVKIDNSKIDGFKITPKNEISYDGVVVNSLLLMKPGFIEKILKKKNQRRLEYYLQYIINLTESEDGDTNPSVIGEALNDLNHYRDIIEYRYRKYLDDKYVDLLLKKVNLLERELKTKLVYIQMNHEISYNYEEEVKGKSR